MRDFICEVVIPVLVAFVALYVVGFIVIFIMASPFMISDHFAANRCEASLVRQGVDLTGTKGVRWDEGQCFVKSPMGDVPAYYWAADQKGAQ